MLAAGRNWRECKNRSKFRLGKIWNFEGRSLMWRQRRGGWNVAADCHGRKDSTDRADAGTQRGGIAFSRTSRFASAEGAGAIGPAQAPAGANRKAKARAGRAEPPPGGTGTRPRGYDRQAHAIARRSRARGLRRAKETRTVARDAGKLRATS